MTTHEIPTPTKTVPPWKRGAARKKDDDEPSVWKHIKDFARDHPGFLQEEIERAFGTMPGMMRAPLARLTNDEVLERVEDPSAPSRPRYRLRNPKASASAKGAAAPPTAEEAGDEPEAAPISGPAPSVEDRVLAHVTVHPEGVTPSEVEKQWGAEGLAALRRLADNRRIARTGAGRSRRYHPLTEEEPEAPAATAPPDDEREDAQDVEEEKLDGRARPDGVAAKLRAALEEARPGGLTSQEIYARWGETGSRVASNLARTGKIRAVGPSHARTYYAKAPTPRSDSDLDELIAAAERVRSLRVELAEAEEHLASLPRGGARRA